MGFDTIEINLVNKTIFSKVIFTFVIRKMAEKQNLLNHTIIFLSEKLVVKVFSRTFVSFFFSESNISTVYNSSKFSQDK